MSIRHTTTIEATEAEEIAASSDLPGATSSSLLRQISLDKGPVGLLGRFVLKAEYAARTRGVWLSVEPIAALGEFVRRELPGWPPLPMFDTNGTALPDDRSFCILGRDAGGRIVATQAVRAYNLPGTLRESAESLDLFYGTGRPPEGAHCEMSAPQGRNISGSMAYSGGGWYHQAHRGHELSAILPRLSRALALTRWGTDFTVSFVDWQLVRKGVVARYGYRHIEDGVSLVGILPEPFSASVVWMDRAGLIADLERFLAEFDGLSGDERGSRDHERTS